MNRFSLFFWFALIVTVMYGGVCVADEIGDGDCMSIACDPKLYEPVCGGLDVESSQGFMNECALQQYNCLHGTEWVVQTEVECEVAFSDSATGYERS